MSKETATEFGAGVCRALGLDPSVVKQLVIRVKGGGYVEVEIESVAAESVLPGLQRLIGEYELAPKGWRELIRHGEE